MKWEALRHENAISLLTQPGRAASHPLSPKQNPLSLVWLNAPQPQTGATVRANVDVSGGIDSQRDSVNIDTSQHHTNTRADTDRLIPTPR
jgi:hypothetical protein